MSEQTFQQLLDRYESDPAFHDALKADPLGAAEAAGIDLDDETRTALQSIEPGMSDEELRTRVSKVYRLP